MPKGSGDAPAPDPRIGEAAVMQAQTGADWLSFAKDAFKVSNVRQAELDALTKRVTEQQLGIGADTLKWAREDRDRYEKTFRPIEDEFLAEAAAYGSPERQEAAAAEAAADVGAAAAAAKDIARREAMAVGINPASGRYAGIERAGETTTALATAGAKNTARALVRDKGLALKADAVNLGRGLPAQAAQGTALGLSAGTGAVGINQGANAQYIASTDIMGGGYRGALAGYGGQASTLNQQYSTQVSAWDAEMQNKNEAAAGIGKAVGGVAGLIFSDEKLKEDKAPIADGDALDAVKEMPVESWSYKEGVADGDRHVGPYAQDFQEATGTGDGKTIALQDAVGITMKAVQDLDAKVERLASVAGLGPSKKKPTTKKPEKEAA